MKKIKLFEDYDKDYEKGKKTALSNFPHLQKKEAEKKEKRIKKSYKEDPDGMYPRDDKRYDDSENKGGWQDGMGKPDWVSESLFKKSNSEWDYVKNEIIDRISSLTIDCPECETIIHDDEQYQCGTCNGGGKIWVKEWIESHIGSLNESQFNLSEGEKWKIYAGLGGGFGNANYVRTFTGTKERAEKEAYYAAIEEYENYEGLHGLRTIDDIMEEDGIEDYEEAQQIYNEERESWLDYYVKPDDGKKE